MTRAGSRPGDVLTTLRITEIAELLALGYLRARKREVARLARARRVRTCSKALDDVPPRAMFETGDSPTFTEG
jgi:hypothetical protein